jgi:hypothetical protein
MTQNIAWVQIVNNTGEQISEVTVLHKYSDVYKDNCIWDRLEAGQTSDGKTVNFNTGFGTTGVDWWLVTWLSQDGRTFYYTDPENFRNLIDVLEDIASRYIGQAGGILGSAIANQVLNNESTSGFKQHILREGDNYNYITLTPNGVQWSSNSGNSSTGVSQRSF